MWALTFASLALVPGLSQNPSSPTPKADAAATMAVPAAPDAAVQVDGRSPEWLISISAMGPVTTTDPQHLAVSVGLAHRGEYRAAVHYQPTDAGSLGMIHASLGFRVRTREAWQLTLDLEHSQARPVRPLFRGSGWELAGHERHQLSIATTSLRWQERRLFGLIRAVEAGAGRMQIWRLVSARAGDSRLSQSPDPILESSAPVGMVGLTAERPLFLGFQGLARLRVIGAGRSPGGEVPFAHLTAEWDVTRQLFQSGRLGRWSFGLTGNHATSSRAVSYFQNGVGLAFRVAY